MTTASTTAPMPSESAAATPSRSTGSELTWPATISSALFGAGVGRQLSPRAARRRAASAASSPPLGSAPSRPVTSEAESVCQTPSTRVSARVSPLRAAAAWLATAAISDRRSIVAGSNKTRTLPVVALAYAWRTPCVPARRAWRRAAHADRPRMTATCRRARPRTATKTIVTGAGAVGGDADLADGWPRFAVEDEALRLEVAVDFGFIRPVPGRRRLEQDVGDQTHQEPSEHQIPSQSRIRG